MLPEHWMQCSYLYYCCQSLICKNQFCHLIGRLAYMPANVVCFIIERHLFENRETILQSQVNKTKYCTQIIFPLTESKMFLFQQFTRRLQRIPLRKHIHQPLEVDLTTQGCSRLWSCLFGSTLRLVWSMTNVHFLHIVFPILIMPISLQTKLFSPIRKSIDDE
jgi:hypothetical protein